MTFKERIKRVYIPGLKRYEMAHQIQCPACKAWFSSLDRRRSGNVRQHIHILAKEEAFHNALDLKTKTPHLNFYKKNVVVRPDSKKFVWTI